MQYLKRCCLLKKRKALNNKMENVEFINIRDLHVRTKPWICFVHEFFFFVILQNNCPPQGKHTMGYAMHASSEMLTYFSSFKFFSHTHTHLHCDYIRYISMYLYLRAEFIYCLCSFELCLLLVLLLLIHRYVLGIICKLHIKYAAQNGRKKINMKKVIRLNATQVYYIQKLTNSRFLYTHKENNIKCAL